MSPRRPGRPNRIGPTIIRTFRLGLEDDAVLLALHEARGDRYLIETVRHLLHTYAAAELAQRRTKGGAEKQTAPLQD